MDYNNPYDNEDIFSEPEKNMTPQNKSIVLGKLPSAAKISAD